MNNTCKLCIALVAIMLCNTSCKKYLDEKSNAALAIPTALTDLQALLDNYDRFSRTGDGSSAEMSADNYYVTTTDWNTLPEEYRRLYTWEKDNILPPYPNNWSGYYNQVYIANTVLDLLPTMQRNSSNANKWDHIYSQAHFWRAKALQQLVFGWCLAYDETTANKDLGLPLRTDADFNKTSIRSSVAETYQLIVQDLAASINGLPVTDVTPMRPTKPAAYGLLARTYLAMRKYDLAGKYADSCLQLKNSLLDYNSLVPTATYPLPAFNTGNIEILLECRSLNPPLLDYSMSKTDSLLYASYATNDLRKSLFFLNNNNGTYGFKGSYEGSGSQFTGIAVDEVWLMRAECQARTGNIPAAMSDLNSLMVKRWKNGSFIPITAANATEALDKILMERRKELLYRNWRWMDIKRLNKEGANIVLKRIINNQTYTLMPNDNKYALPIPEQVIALSGMPQNPR